MDAFFAAVEQLDRPEFAGKPVIVGGAPEGRGVVSAASYEARTFGVHSAMPMKQALRLCPKAVLLPVRMERYVEVSREVHAVFEEFTPMVEPVSIDEAFLDVTGSRLLFGNSMKIGRELKQTITARTGLPCSVGVAPNKFLAKLGSDLEKPDGFVVITEENKQDVLDPLSVGKIWGIGKVTERSLQAKGIYTIAHLRHRTEHEIEEIVGNSASLLLKLAHGIDERPLEITRQAKSISSETTFANDISDEDILLAVLVKQVEEVAHRLRSIGLKARTATIKLRYGNFRTVTRSKTFRQPSCATGTLWKAARAIFKKWQFEAQGPLRLIGFSASGFELHETDQQLLFQNHDEEKQDRLDVALDSIRKRFGKDALRRGLPAGFTDDPQQRD